MCSVSALAQIATNRHMYEDINLLDARHRTSGYLLHPNTLYLGHTAETIGSDQYNMSLIGRSSIGRLGLYVQYDADLGHTSICHQWTLEIRCILPVVVRAGMKIGQVEFRTNFGEFTPYTGKHAQHNGAQHSLTTELTMT